MENEHPTLALWIALDNFEDANAKLNRAMIQARDAGMSLSAIGQAVGMSKQAVAHRLKVIRSKHPQGGAR